MYNKHDYFYIISIYFICLLPKQIETTYFYIKIIISLFLITYIGDSFSQNHTISVDARANGMGNAVVSNKGLLSLINNIGGLGDVRTSEFILSHRIIHDLPFFNSTYIGYIKPAKKGTLGFDIFRFGDDLYNEHRLGIGFSNVIDKVSLGVKAHLLQYMIEGLGTRRVVFVEFGGVTQFSEQLFFGTNIYNVNQANISSQGNETIPIIIRMGLSYIPYHLLIINIETEKDVDLPPLLKLGLEYEFTQNLFARVGLNHNPFRGFWGFGIAKKKFSLDISLGSSPVLGISNEFSIVYHLDGNL